MNRIEINYETIDGIISELVSALNSNQSEIASAYSSLAGSFLESAGEEADALRCLQKAERNLMKEMNGVLIKFGESIRFAADEFKNMDRTGAAVMTGAAKKLAAGVATAGIVGKK